MKLLEIEQEALALTEQDRATLVVSLMDTLTPPDIDVSDREALARDAEMESGAVRPMLQEEFVRRVGQGRRG